MPELGTSGSVGAPGEQSPGATQPPAAITRRTTPTQFRTGTIASRSGAGSSIGST